MPRKPYLCLDDYDCIGFDLDHTLCRYNIGPMVRLEYDLLAEFLVSKKGYDPSIRTRSITDDADFVCKGLTLDCEKGNLVIKLWMRIVKNCINILRHIHVSWQDKGSVRHFLSNSFLSSKHKSHFKNSS